MTKRKTAIEECLGRIAKGSFLGIDRIEQARRELRALLRLAGACDMAKGRPHIMWALTLEKLVACRKLGLVGKRKGAK